MLKAKIPKIVLMILTSFFCLHFTGLTVADECWNSEGGGPTFTGNHNYPSGWFPEFQYDPNNPDEIDRNSSIEISVIEGFPPYTWQVSGTGFSIPSSTTDRTNTLSADDTSCGAATIAITDKYGDSCTGYVRCTEGSEWQAVCTNATNFTGCSPWQSIWGGYSFDIIEGNKKWEMLGRDSGRTSKCCPPGADCTWDGDCVSPPCGDPCSCDGVVGRCGEGTLTLWPYYTYYEWGCS